MDQKRVEEMMKGAENQMEKGQIVLQALQNQRKGALKELERKANNLLNDASQLTKPNLEGEESGKILANTLREIVTSVNSVQLTLDAHDKLIDMLINDLGGMLDQLNGTTNGLIQTSMMVEVMLKTLMDKGIFTEDELKEAHKVVAQKTRDMVNATQEAKE